MWDGIQCFYFDELWFLCILKQCADFSEQLYQTSKGEKKEKESELTLNVFVYDQYTVLHKRNN